MKNKDLISVYTKYVDRITEHYHIGLRQFQVYFAFSSGLVALVAYVAKASLEQYLSNPADFSIPPGLGRDKS